MTLDLRSLDLFVRVARLGNIGRAGAELGLSSTNASQRLRQLEAELSVRLLSRTTRAVSLTADGALLLTHAQRILSEVGELHDMIGGEVRGRLRVTASASFGRTHIVPFVPSFLARYPGLTLDLDLSDTIVDIVEQGYDLAFRSGELAPSTLLARKIDDNPRAIVAAPAYLACHGSPQAPSDLSRHICLSLRQDSHWAFLKGHETARVAVTGPVSTNLGDAVAAWVLDGLGIGMASLWHAGPDIRAGRLIRLLPDWRVEPQTSIWAIRPPAPFVPRRTSVFLEHIRDCIRETNRARYGDLLP